jgi:hypothetical protein
LWPEFEPASNKHSVKNPRPATDNLFHVAGFALTPKERKEILCKPKVLNYLGSSKSTLAGKTHKQTKEFIQIQKYCAFPNGTL